MPLRSIRSTSMTGWRSEAEMLEALDRAKGSQRLEGIELSAEQEALVLRRLREEISEEEFIRLAVELATRSDKPAA
jgi:hypothetical protein